MNRPGNLGLCMVLLGVAAFGQEPAPASPLPGESVLAKRPTLLSLQPFAAPVAHEVKLANGLRLLLVHRPGAPILSLNFVARRGSLADPAHLPGLASLSAAMLEAGSAGKSQTDIAAMADALGTSLGVGAGPDETHITLSALPSRFPEMARLLADVVLRPNLEEAEWQKLKTQRLGRLQAQLAEPQVGANLAFHAALYGDDPLGHPALGTPTSVQAASLSDVKMFLGAIRPESCALVVVGSIPEKTVVKTLAASFGQPWARQGNGPQATEAHPAASSPVPRLVTVDFPGRPQTVVVVGQVAIPSGSKDALPLRLVNSVLGGSFTSRLNQNLREAHGYTYGASSSFAFGNRPGPFAVRTSVKTENTGAAVAEVFKELDRIVAEPLPDDDLSKGKALLAFQLVQSLQSAQATAALVADLFVHGLPPNDLATFVPRLRALKSDAVRAAVQRVLKPGTMTILLAGDAQVVLPQLPAAGLALPAPKAFSPAGEALPSK
ncbi:MAG TPA: pitrilysin family protein [Geothrix sp.]